LGTRCETLVSTLKHFCAPATNLALAVPKETRLSNARSRTNGVEFIERNGSADCGPLHADKTKVPANAAIATFI
jgi:hypothetical protein